jgi:hypothetical protein
MPEMIEKVATAIVASIKAQMDGHPIPGVPPSVDSWTATGGVIDGNLLARAAIEAMSAELMERRDRAELTEPQWRYIADFLDEALSPSRPQQ